MDPKDPNTLYAAMWQRVRRKWSDPRVEPGYNEGGIIKTTDGGATWSTPARACRRRSSAGGSASTSHGRIPTCMYAFVDNYEIGSVPPPGSRDAYGRPMPQGQGFIKGADIYRSDDAGKTWKQTSRFDQATNNYLDDHSGTYGWVFGQIRVDPANENTIYTLGLSLNVSRDGGRTFTRIGGMHGDHHGLWIDPANPEHPVQQQRRRLLPVRGRRQVLEVRGARPAARSSTTSKWTRVRRRGSTARSRTSAAGAARIDLSKGAGAVPAVRFESAPGGEGSNQAVDPTNPNIVYSHGFYGNFSRTDLGQRWRRPRRRDPSTPIQPPDPDNELRAQWMAPFIISPHDHTIVYAGYQFLYRSNSRGDKWEKISGDLTDNSKSQMGENPSAIPYQTIVALAESPKKKDLLYVGTDDGRLHTTIDGGKEWTELTTKLPVRRWLSRVVPSMHAEGTVYVTQRGREDDDFAAYIYKSTDYGKTFTSIVNNIPAGPVNVIREDPRNPSVLYVGTDFGVYVSTTGGARWEVLGGNLPSVQVSDLQFQPRDNVIVISTYGRGIWVFDATKCQQSEPQNEP